MLLSLRYLLLIICGASFGLLAAAGVFTVLVAVGLIPRFAGKTHTAKKVMLYEEMVIAGTVIGGLVSVFERYCHIGDWLLQQGLPHRLLQMAGNAFLVIFGILAGMFIGCLALAIAEMLDSVPIFARRVGFRHGLGIAISAMAAGKLVGSLFYFAVQLHEVIP
ncbi:MAG: stage V sporulation protein AB [Lachnospiraceae bacterium]|nr:stage V sporulation protein AB [Lachnospiraceae bacterium]